MLCAKRYQKGEKSTIILGDLCGIGAVRTVQDKTQCFEMFLTTADSTDVALRQEIWADMMLAMAFMRLEPPGPY